MNALMMALLLVASGPLSASAEAARPPGKPAPPQGAPALKEFESRFRAAVLKKDVAWILANMDPTGWACGDAEMPAGAYAEAFRQGHMDYSLLFGPINAPRASSATSGPLTYQEWFARCPDATAVEAIYLDEPGADRLYAVRWQGAGCPQEAPGFVIAVHGARLGIRTFSGCM